VVAAEADLAEESTAWKEISRFVTNLHRTSNKKIIALHGKYIDQEIKGVHGWSYLR
jgi:hypothetical protein